MAAAPKITGSDQPANYPAVQNAVADIVDANTTARLLTAVKTADEQITETTTLQDDDHLTVTVEPSKRYVVEAWINFDAASGTPDIVVGWSLPTGATMQWGLTDQSYNTLNQTGTHAEAGSTIDQTIPIVGHLLVDTTAGNVTMQWAQQTSSTDFTRVFAGSWLRLTPLA